MERVFDQLSVIRILKEGIKKGYWTLEDLDTPPPGWLEVVNDCKGNPLFPKGYQGPEYKNLARIELPSKPIEEKVEVVDPRDYSTKEEQTYF